LGRRLTFFFLLLQVGEGTLSLATPIERIVVLGVKKPQKVVLKEKGALLLPSTNAPSTAFRSPLLTPLPRDRLSSGLAGKADRNLEFEYSTDPSNKLVIRKPDVAISADWTLVLDVSGWF
jgi:hypothetical protein